MAVKERTMDKLFACRLPMEIHEWLEQEARTQRRTKTEILRHLLFTQMQAQGQYDPLEATDGSSPVSITRGRDTRRETPDDYGHP